MRKGMTKWFVVLCCGTLLAAGCAHKEPVKPSEPVGGTQTQQPAVSAPSEQGTQQTAPRTTETPAPAPVPETRTDQTSIATETGKEAPAAAGQLESELQKIYFDFDSSSLSPDARTVLSKNAEYLSKNPGVKVRIEGNCDERGSDEYNMALGERRAKAARDYLVRLGVPADRLSVISYGLEKPAETGHDEAAWAKNRRAEFVVVK